MLDEVGRGVAGLLRAEVAWGAAAGVLGAALRWLVPAARALLTPGLVAALAAAAVLRSPVVALAGAAVAIVEWRRPPAPVASLALTALATAAAAAATSAALTRSPPFALVVFAALALAWIAFAAPDRVGPAGVALALVTALGWYAGLPDTEAALVVVGVAAASFAAVTRVGWAPFAAAGAAVVVWGSAGRPAALVGGVVCAGMLGASPLRRGTAAGEGPATRSRTALPEIAVHAALVVYGARVVGRPQPAAQALLLALPAVVVVAAAAFFLRGRRAG